MTVSRRSLLKAASLGLAAGVGTAALPSARSTSAGALSLPKSLNEIGYRLTVPEIFKPAPTVPTHSQMIVIGSGFGASVAALRFAQAGVQVSMLERGSRWPRDPHRSIFATDANPDGRGFWHRTSFKNVAGFTNNFDNFGGVLDATDYANIQVWRGAAVGGGSVVFTAAMVQPEQRFFDAVFGGSVDYAEMNSTWYPLVRKMLNFSTMPADIYNSSPFGHSRAWDAQAIKAGYTPQSIDSLFQWDVVRKELSGAYRASAIIGESDLGNADGAKNDLTQNYIPMAEATGKVVVYSGHVVTSIGAGANGGYVVTVNIVEPNGTLISTRTLTCDYLVLGAGSIGSSELLVRAKATGTLPKLDPSIGTGWGTNGDAAISRVFDSVSGITQGAPSASRIVDESTGMPISMENWDTPGLPINLGILGTLGMALDSTRANFRYVASTNSVTLDWPVNGSARTVAAFRTINNKIASANKVVAGVPGFAADVNTAFTAHPLGGAVLGQSTDGYGRVKNYPGLYVFDGAAIPGSTGTANPSLTITALAERNTAAVIKAGG